MPLFLKNTFRWPVSSQISKFIKFCVACPSWPAGSCGSAHSSFFFHIFLFSLAPHPPPARKVKSGVISVLPRGQGGYYHIATLYPAGSSLVQRYTSAACKGLCSSFPPKEGRGFSCKSASDAAVRDQECQHTQGALFFFRGGGDISFQKFYFMKRMGLPKF